MDKKQKNRALLTLIEAALTLLFGLSVLLSKYFHPESPISLAVRQVIAVLLLSGFLLYIAVLIRGRSGKRKCAPLLLAAGAVIGIGTLCLAMVCGTELPENRFLLVILAGVVGLVCLRLLFRLGRREGAAHTALSDENDALRYLKERIEDTMTLSGLVDVFAEMGRLPLQNGLGGPFCFACGTREDGTFVFRLARQTVSADHSHVHITMDAVFAPDEAVNVSGYAENSPLWSFQVDRDFFESIKSSAPYWLLKARKPLRTNLYLD